MAQYVAFLSTPANQGGDKDRGDTEIGYEGNIEETQGQDVGDRGDTGTGLGGGDRGDTGRISGIEETQGNEIEMEQNTEDSGHTGIGHGG